MSWNAALWGKGNRQAGAPQWGTAHSQESKAGSLLPRPDALGLEELQLERPDRRAGPQLRPARSQACTSGLFPRPSHPQQI